MQNNNTADERQSLTVDDDDKPRITIQKHTFEEEPVESVSFSPLRRQFLAVSPTLFVGISTGTLYGYSATLLPELQKEGSDITVTANQATWIASTMPLVMSIACLIGGPIMDRYGRKMTHLILSVPLIMCWVTTYWAPNVEMIIIGRVLGGLGIGMHGPLFPVYVGEVCEPRYRGAFLATPSMAMTFGIFAIHLSGTFLSWKTSALIGTVIPIVGVVLLIFVPETPSWYISKNRFDEAFYSYQWLRGNRAKSEFDEMCAKQRQTGPNTGICAKLGDTIRKPELRRPFLIIFVAFILLEFSGPYIVAFYSVLILEKTLGSTVDEYLVMNVIDVLRLVMALVASFLLKTTRRRFMMIASGIGTAVSTLALAGFLVSSNWFPIDQHTWFPIAALIIYIIFVCAGIMILPWCLMGELLPLSYRGLLSGVLTSFNFILLFFIIKVFPALLETLHVSGVFVIFGATSVVCALILFFIQPETKDRTLVEIEKEFTR